METIIEKRYESHQHFDYPEMEKLIDQVIENPDKKFTIPKKFLVKKYNGITFFDVLIHRIKVFVRSIWLNLKKAFDQDYRNRFKLAVKKIIHAYGRANKVTKTAEQNFVPPTPPSANDRQVQTLEQQLSEQLIKQKIEESERQLQLSTDEEDAKQNEEEELPKIEERTTKDQVAPLVNTPKKPVVLAATQDTQESEKIISTQQGVDTQNQKVEKAEKKEVKPIVKTPYQALCEAIESRTGNASLSRLWKTLFDNATVEKERHIDDYFNTWSCDENDKFTIRLKKPLHFWINTARVGGCVFSFGNNESKAIRGSFKDNKIVFDSGFTSYCVENLWLAWKRVEPKMNDIHYINKRRIEMSGTCWGMTKSHESTYTDMLKEWSKSVTVIPDDYPGGYKQFLEEKFNEQK